MDTSMHDMLEEMGKDIVRQEDLEERNRLWSLKDMNQVSKYDKVNKSIEGINVHMIETENIQLCPTIFGNMLNLRYMDFCVPWRLLENEKLLVDGVDSVSLPNELRYLGWDFYPFKSLSPSLNPKNLVILKLWRCNMEHLWNDDHQDLVYLRKIDLTDCKNLRKIPNLLGAINLKSLDCSGCESLVELSRLTHLTSLETLRLSGCSSLEKFPELPNNLSELDLSFTGNEEVPNSIEHLFSV
ncbi:disease resistance protein RPS6-like [Hibiscus syriacus]|uniref:disease resistance protein RPS6-like n=1 Tax=Hibiscus syriacus TaxID=106335 RepID=UPI0019235BA6|nr:disease resistance protein RPS6-like [Hibiscus syriacus]